MARPSGTHMYTLMSIMLPLPPMGAQATHRHRGGPGGEWSKSLYPTSGARPTAEGTAMYTPALGPPCGPGADLVMARVIPRFLVEARISGIH
eukprot:8571711-Pyramimonas_sp.AAC.1